MDSENKRADTSNTPEGKPPALTEEQRAFFQEKREEDAHEEQTTTLREGLTGTLGRTVPRGSDRSEKDTSDGTARPHDAAPAHAPNDASPSQELGQVPADARGPLATATHPRKRPPSIVFAFGTVLVAALACAVIALFVPAGTKVYVPLLSDIDQPKYLDEEPEDAPANEGAQEPVTPVAPAGTSPQQEETSATSAKPADTQDTNTQKDSATHTARERSDKRSTASSVTEKDKYADEEKVEPRSIKHELGGEAEPLVRASNAFGLLTQAIGAFEDEDYTVAFVIHDLANDVELTYNSDEELYPASSIKGPFTTSIYQQLIEAGEVELQNVEPVARETILESSDEGYRTLHNTYGETAFINWLKDAGVEPGSYETYESMMSWNYPHICAKQLALMWIHIYDYLTSTDSDASRQLAELFDKREVSSLRKAVDPDVRTWSKMGWFESFSDYRSEPATVEGGVVFSEEGPYVVSLMTTAPAKLDELVPLLAALDRAHYEMV